MAKSFILAKATSTWEANEKYSLFCNPRRWNVIIDNKLSFHSQNKKEWIYLWAEYWGKSSIFLGRRRSKDIEIVSFVSW